MQHFGGFRGAVFWLEVITLAADTGVPVPRVAGRVLRTTRGNRLWLFQSNLSSSRPPYVFPKYISVYPAELKPGIFAWETQGTMSNERE